mgnify:CR=1 FL=1
MQRSSVLVVVGAFALAACGSDQADEVPGTAEAGVVEYRDSEAEVVLVEQPQPAPRDESRPSGLATFRSPDPSLPPPTIDLSVLRSGGPPPDGIPSIDVPKFHRASTVDYLGDDDPVIALEIDGDARAYPLEILIWHELVNDTVGGVPVSVAYCPLCNSVTVYEREIDGRVLDFGVSGLLYNSSLVMYDRQTETLWSHFTGEPLHGAHWSRPNWSAGPQPSSGSAPGSGSTRTAWC